MTRHWLIAALMFGLAFGASQGVEAVLSTCNGGQFVVDTQPASDALGLAGGYDNDQCNLIIKSPTPTAPLNVNPNTPGFILRGNTIQILGDGTSPLNIINAQTSGDISILTRPHLPLIS